MWSDKESNEDYLNFGEVSNLAVDILTTPDMLPVSIGVFGNWGAGKSSSAGPEMKKKQNRRCFSDSGFTDAFVHHDRSRLGEAQRLPVPRTGNLPRLACFGQQNFRQTMAFATEEQCRFRAAGMRFDAMANIAPDNGKTPGDF